MNRQRAARTIELLRGTLTSRDDLPEREPEPLDDLRKLFTLSSGHRRAGGAAAAPAAGGVALTGRWAD